MANKKTPKANKGRDANGKFLPGHSITDTYADWIKKLTPEQLAKHKQDRKVRKTRRQDFNAILDANREEWLSDLHTGMKVMAEKAKAGDQKAMDSLHDKLLEKEKESLAIDMTSTVDVNISDEQMKQMAALLLAAKDDGKND